jgi:hypothetical protein
MKQKLIWSRIVPVIAAITILPVAFNNCSGGFDSKTLTQNSGTPSDPTSDSESHESGPPLSFNDARFSNATSLNQTMTVSDGGSVTDKSIQEYSGNPTITCSGSCTLTRVRVDSRECIRGVQGDIVITDSYLEATGAANDHADVIQTYSPGSNGAITLRNTSIVAHNNDATAGIFVADNWKPDLVDLENVMFQSGPYGLRLHADGYNNAHLRMKNVCFVGPFGYDMFIIDGFIIDEWTNVNECVIQNGQLVIIQAIPHP